jgi:branched-chain amino acid transport system substrate-binding protein
LSVQAAGVWATIAAIRWDQRDEGRPVRLDVPIVLGLLATAVGVGAATAQISNDVVRLGVLNDQSNVYADLGGPGSVIAARMAIEDVGGKVLRKPVEILVADHQSKDGVIGQRACG